MALFSEILASELLSSRTGGVINKSPSLCIIVNSAPHSVLFLECWGGRRIQRRQHLQQNSETGYVYQLEPMLCL